MTSCLPLEPTAEPGSSRQSSTPLLDSILLYGVLGLVLFGPVAFGAVEPWSIALLQAGAGLLFALWSVRQVTAGELDIIGNPLFLPMSFFAAIVLLQQVTGRTAYRAETFSTGLLYCTYGIVSFLVVQLLRRKSQVRILAWLISGYGSAIALFGLIQGIASNGKLYWLRTAQFGGWIYGPYVNHNHYAGLMEMLAPIPLVISLRPDMRRPHRALAGLSAAVMASTIFLSGSRGGMVAFAVELLMFTAFLTKRRQDLKAVVALAGFLATAVALLAWLGGDDLLQRLASFHSTAQVEISGGTRLTIGRDALKMFAQKPLMGWGLGVFAEIYPQFRSFPTNLLVDRAHNDYLQILVETGALGFATVLWFLVRLYQCSLRKLRRWPPDSNSAITLAALLGVSGILVHSCVDFNLQIPANAALFYVLCVVAAMKPSFGLHHRPHRWHHYSEELPNNLTIPATVSIG